MDILQLLQNPTTIAIAVCIIVACIVAYFVLSSYNKNTKYNSNREHEDDGNSSNKTAHLLLFYAEWCPHCKTAKPEWDAVKEEYDGKTINDYTVVFEEYNCSTPNAEIEELMNKYDVGGYPTLKLIKDGQIIEYDAKITKALIEQFLTTVL